MSYEITITEVYIGPDHDNYPKKTVIYQQTLEKLDIAAVVTKANEKPTIMVGRPGEIIPIP